MSYLGRLAATSVCVLILNLPFGYWRAGLRKLSISWFVAIHAPVPLVFALRMGFGLGFRWVNVPIFATMFFTGQFLGTRLRSRPGGPLYARWILANGWAEAAGLGTTLLLGSAVAPWFTDAVSPLAVIAGAILAVLLGTVLEGVLVGWAQGRVLERAWPKLFSQPSRRAWIRATALGAGIAWLLGMVPSTIFSLAGGDQAGVSMPSEPSAWLQIVLALALGLALGAILGFAQGRVFRAHGIPAGAWIGANAAAWALGMAVIFAGMGRVPWALGGIQVAAGVYLVTGVAGLAVGAVHGAALLRLRTRFREIEG